MNDRYYIFSNGRKRGPFSLVDLLDETECGNVEYEDLCLRIGATTCEKVREALDWEDSHLISASVTPYLDVLPTAETAHPELTENEITEYGEVYSEEGNTSDALVTNEEESEEDFEEDYSNEYESDLREIDEGDNASIPEDSPNEESEYFDEAEILLEADDDIDAPMEYEEPSSSAPYAPLPDSNTLLYSGRPSLLSYPKSLLMVVFSLVSGIYFRDHSDWILLAGITFALLFFVQAQLRRSRHQYFITPKRVEVIHGLILENSREVRIEDIGAIHIRQRGLQGLLGLASIEFAAIESPMPILVFYNVRAARRIKGLVRRLQDALENSE